MAIDFERHPDLSHGITLLTLDDNDVFGRFYCDTKKPDTEIILVLNTDDRIGSTKTLAEAISFPSVVFRFENKSRLDKFIANLTELSNSYKDE